MKTHLTLLLLWPVLLLGQSTSLRVSFEPNCPYADFFQRQMPWFNYSSDSPDVTVNGDDTYLYFIENQNVGSRVTHLEVARFGPTNDSLSWLKAYRRGLLPYLLQNGQVANFDYTLPDAPTAWEVVHDPWHQRVYRLSGSGSWSQNRFSDLQPNNVEVSRTRLETDNRVAFDFWKITPRHRLSTGLSTAWGRERQTSSNLPPVASAPDRNDHSFVIDFDNEWVRALSQHWSLGTRANASWQDFEYTFTFPGVPIGQTGDQIGVVSASVGAEWSLWPYRQFFRRRLLVNYLLNVNRSSSGSYDRLPVNVSNVLLVRSTVIRQWGFGDGQISAAVPIPNQANTYAVGVGFFGEMGWNVGKHLQLGGSLYGSWSQSGSSFTGYFPDGTVLKLKFRQRDIQLNPSVLVAYFFGSRNANVVNPRLNNFRTGNF